MICYVNINQVSVRFIQLLQLCFGNINAVIVFLDLKKAFDAVEPRDSFI